MSPLRNIRPDDKDRLLSVIHRALSINKHIDFFLWLQQDIRYFLPHDVLVAAWGDFANGKISYDVASSIPGIRTQKVIDGSDIDPLVSALYFRWLTYDQQWYALNHFDLLAVKQEKNIKVSSIGQLASMKSVLVHGIHDKRSNDDCLYIFFTQNSTKEIDQGFLNLLLPHIDAALRRVECLSPTLSVPAILAKTPWDVSGREDEILKWVGLGKTNSEIGMILNISPNTVKNHLKKIFQKLDVSSRAQAVSKYKAHKIVPPQVA